MRALALLLAAPHPDFQLSPDSHTAAIAVAKPSECGVSETGIYTIAL